MRNSNGRSARIASSTLEEGIMRLAGPGMMKGESPVSRREQSEATIESYVRQHLLDAGGVLPSYLFRHVTNSELFLANLDQPLDVLANCISRSSAPSICRRNSFVRPMPSGDECLARGLILSEQGSLPHPDDPYTVESVRIKLTQLLEKLMQATARFVVVLGHSLVTAKDSWYSI